MIARQRTRDRSEAAGAPARGLTIVIGEAREARRGCAVTSPSRLMRTWRTLTALNGALHADATDARAVHRAIRTYGTLREEIIRSVSAPLAREVHRMIPPLEEDAGVVEARMACAGALGWLDALMTSMLMQLAGQGAAVAAADGPDDGPDSR
ncbi:hypothetical protein [Actinomadura sediminis]|uniref:Bacterial proteasome activator n=1 Tax=Actinomadura sediminis TaxID=1038904 RepID=A0ABW3EIS3_9ACTN